MHLKYKYSYQQYDEEFMAIADYGPNENKLKIIWVNEIGKDIMQLLQNETDIDSVIEKIKAVYQGDEDDIKKAVKNFVEKLDDVGIIEK